MPDEAMSHAPLFGLADLGFIVAYAFSDDGPYDDVDITDAEVEFTLHFGIHPCDDLPYLIGPMFSYVGERRTNCEDICMDECQGACGVL